ncbi:MAG: polyprenyl synthetase family protein [Planctomycetota bacterium]
MIYPEIVDIKDYIQEAAKRIDKALDKFLPSETEFPEKIHEAMRYSVFAGGKRLRPFLVLESSRICSGDEQKAMPVACAFEFVHTYSLIHDDLPAMDNDDIRRGMPTSHKKFDEATAILAGDALLTYAFYIIAREITEPDAARRVILELSSAAGSRGMVGGQILDISEPPEKGRGEHVKSIHELKTTALIMSATRCGAIVVDASPDEFSALSQYGRCLGLAFQITDDILDIESTKQVLGKSTGKDITLGRLTYPAVYGIEESRKIAKQLIDKATVALEIFGSEAVWLQKLAKYILIRNK